MMIWFFNMIINIISVKEQNGKIYKEDFKEKFEEIDFVLIEQENPVKYY